MKLDRTLYVANRKDWRAWLRKNHASETEVWLIYFKKHTGRPRIPYDDAVEEALCFGWIDSTVHSLDEESYAQRFTPRKEKSQWSESNRRRLRKLLAEGRMTKAGLAKVSPEVLENLDKPAPPPEKKELVVPPYIEKAFKSNRTVWENFNNLAPSYRRNYVGWIEQAKREETRQKRLKESIELLKQNKKLGMK